MLKHQFSVKRKGEGSGSVLGYDKIPYTNGKPKTKSSNTYQNVQLHSDCGPHLDGQLGIAAAIQLVCLTCLRDPKLPTNHKSSVFKGHTYKTF